jgi:hypothetical protein
MGKPIEFTFIGNARKLIKETGDIQREFDDVKDSLKDLGKEGDNTGDDIAKGLDQGADKAGRSIDDLEDEFREMEKKGKAAADDTGDAIGKKIKAGTDKAEEGLDEFKSEANSTARESAASFDGSAESIVDSFQEIAANAFAGFGPAGAAAGLALALGLGAAITAGQAAADAINEAKERSGELAQEIVEAGGDIAQVDIASKLREWGVAIKDNREFWELWQDSAYSNMDKAEEKAEQTGVGFKEMFRALSGYDAGATDRVLASVGEQIGDLEEKIRDARAAGNVFAGVRDEDGLALDSLRGIRRELTGVKDERGDAAKAAEMLQEATEAETAAAEANAAAEQAASDATAARNSAISALQSGLDSAVGSYGDFTNAESGATDPGKYIAGMQARIDATSGFAGNVSRLADEFGLSQAETQAILDQGVDFGPMLQSIMDSGLAPEFIAQIQRAVGGGQELLDGTPLGTKVEVTAEVAPAESMLSLLSTKPRDSKVKAKAETDAADAQLKATADKPRQARIQAVADTVMANLALGIVAGVGRTARITAVASTGDADAALDRLASRRRTTTIVARVVDREGKAVN